MVTHPNVSRVTCHVSHVMCHVSRVTCHVSHVTCNFFSFFFSDKVVKLIGGGSVINGAYPVQFQGRYQSVRWRGLTTSPRRINVGGPQGATLGILEYLSQSNNSADCVSSNERCKLVDDLTILEIVNLLTVGIDQLLQH